MTTLNIWLLIFAFVWAAITISTFWARITGIIHVSWWIVSATIWVPVLVMLMLLVVAWWALRNLDLG